MITVNYKKDKIYLYLILTFFVSLMLVWLYFDAEAIALKEIQSGKHRFVRNLFYKNAPLLKLILSILFGICIVNLYHFSKLLICPKIVFKVSQNTLRKNDQTVVEISNIEKIELRSVHKNSFIVFHLKDYELFLKNSNFLKKIRYQTLNFKKEKSIFLNINFLEIEPKSLLRSLKKMISETQKTV